MIQKIRFKSIANAYKDFIFTYAYYFTGTREDAEDVTQEVLLKIWQNMDTLRKGITKSWVSTVTRNLCIDWARWRTARPDMTIAADAEDDDQFSAPPVHISTAEQNELRSTIEKAIARLPEQLRSVVILREIEELKYEEISEVLDIPLNSVKSYIHRGRRLLREQLTALYKDDYCRR